MSVLQNSSLTRRKRIEVSLARPTSKKPKRELYQNRIRLPRIYKFILIPQNGTENYAIPNPRQNTPLYTELENMQMIQTITFTQGDADYCRQQVVTAFQRFHLEEWNFYRANGRSTLIHAEMYDCQTFDLIQLAGYLLFHFSDCRLHSGQEIPKKIYIGPIFPQSFVPIDSDSESTASNRSPQAEMMDIEQLDVLSDDGLDLPPSEEIHRVDSIRQCSSIPTLAMDLIPAPNI
jgi:hypothetical protein